MKRGPRSFSSKFTFDSLDMVGTLERTGPSGP